MSGEGEGEGPSMAQLPGAPHIRCAPAIVYDDVSNAPLFCHPERSESVLRFAARYFTGESLS